MDNPTLLMLVFLVRCRPDEVGWVWYVRILNPDGGVELK